jgi:hypothetical protein
MFYEAGVGHRLTSHRSCRFSHVSPIAVSLIFFKYARNYRSRFLDSSSHVVDIRRNAAVACLAAHLDSRLTFHSNVCTKVEGHHDGQTDYLFSRHMPVLRSRTANGIEPKYDRNRPHHGAAINTVCNLRAPPRDVGRQRDRAWSNPRIRGNSAFLGAHKQYKGAPSLSTEVSR